MSITSGILSGMADAMRNAMGDLMSLQQVDVYEAGTVQVKLHVGRRRLTSTDVTAGADAENQYATIDAADWDAKVGRIPQKGDRITWVGRRYAVDDCQVISPDGGPAVFYKSRLRG